MMTKLATLGGANGIANLNNNRGEVVGFAETNKIDAACPGISEFKPVVWASGKIQELPTFPGDSDGGAFGINDNGQVVGSSGPCTPGFNPQSQVYFVPVHALLWQNGAATDLGNLGGDGEFAGNHACAINNRGQVVGHSDLTDDATAHAFLWTRETRMSDLGTIPGDFASFALGINDRGEVVGASVDANFNPRAFLWDNGAMVDLNTLIPANSGLSLQLAESINSSGQIVGFGQTSTGEVHGFLASPAISGDDREDGLTAARPGAPAIASKSARKLLFQRLRIRAR
jgi:probable HAF family extracellular repeat protein